MTDMTYKDFKETLTILKSMLQNPQYKNKNKKDRELKELCNRTFSHLDAIEACVKIVKEPENFDVTRLNIFCYCIYGTFAPPAVSDFLMDWLTQKWMQEIISHALTFDRPCDFDSSARQNCYTRLRYCLASPDRTQIKEHPEHPVNLIQYVKCWTHMFRRENRVYEFEYMTIIAKCNADCVTLIADYATLVCESSAVESLERTLRALQAYMQRLNDLNAVTKEACVQASKTYKFTDQDIDTLGRTEKVIEKIWVMWPYSWDEGVDFPGLFSVAGNVLKIPMPKDVVMKGSNRILVNCFCFLFIRLDYSFPPYTTRYIDASAAPRQQIQQGVCAFLETVQSSFEQHELANYTWSSNIAFLASKLKTAICTDMPTATANKTQEGQLNFERIMQAERLQIEARKFWNIPGKCEKVKIAERMFSHVHLHVKEDDIKIDDWSERIYDERCGQLKYAKQMGGKVLRDLAELVKDRPLLRTVEIDTKAKQVVVKGGVETNLAFMEMLIEYMQQKSAKRSEREKFNFRPNLKRKLSRGVGDGNGGEPAA